MTRKSADDFTPSGVQGGIYGRDLAGLADEALAARTRLSLIGRRQTATNPTLSLTPT